MTRRTYLICVAGLALAVGVVSALQAGGPETDLELLAAFAAECPYAPRAWEPDPPPQEIVDALQRLKAAGRVDHFPYLLEYGLRAHWKNLEGSRLARELPVEGNFMLAELIRIAAICNYTTAHEAGWVDRQFDGHFEGMGYSSYQVFVWLKEQPFAARKDYPNIAAISDLEKTIDASGLGGLGGGGVCHYGCK